LRKWNVSTYRNLENKMKYGQIRDLIA